jgi:hypothetical protein
MLPLRLLLQPPPPPPLLLLLVPPLWVVAVPAVLVLASLRGSDMSALSLEPDGARDSDACGSGDSVVDERSEATVAGDADATERDMGVGGEDDEAVEDSEDSDTKRDW